MEEVNQQDGESTRKQWTENLQDGEPTNNDIEIFIDE